MKKWMCVLTALLITVTMYGCGSKKPSEKVVKEDVQAHLSEDFEGYEISDIEIVKSTTEKNSYYAEVEYTAKKAFVEGNASGRLYYRKYDGGKWVLENAVIGEPDK